MRRSGVRLFSPAPSPLLHEARLHPLLERARRCIRALLVQQHARDDAGGNGDQQVVVALLHPVVAARRRAQVMAAPVVDHIRVRTVLGGQPVTALPAVLVAVVAPVALGVAAVVAVVAIGVVAVALVGLVALVALPIVAVPVVRLLRRTAAGVAIGLRGPRGFLVAAAKAGCTEVAVLAGV